MKYSFTHHFAAMYSLNFKLEKTDRIMVGLEEQTKRKAGRTDTKKGDQCQKMQRRAGGAGAGCGE